MTCVAGRQSNRQGFSLLEVILALGLSSLLLAAVYSALQMHWTYSTLGQVEMERSQIARALFRRIETDLRSVVFQPSSSSTTSTDGSSASSSGSSSSGSSASNSSSSGSNGSSTSGASGTANSGASNSTGSSSSTDSSSSTTDSESTITQKNGIFGDALTLIVHSSLPSRSGGMLATNNSSGSNTANAASIPSSSDLQTIAYFMAGSGSSLAQQLSSGMENSVFGQPVTGLARMQGDRMAMTQADQNGDMSSLASQTKLLAAEVASISFEYYDGVSWTTTWDTATSNTIPNAIRVTIEFQPPDQTRGGWFARPVNTSTNRYSQVIALPLAEPYVDTGTL